MTQKIEPGDLVIADPQTSPRPDRGALLWAEYGSPRSVGLLRATDVALALGLSPARSYVLLLTSDQVLGWVHVERVTQALDEKSGR